MHATSGSYKTLLTFIYIYYLYYVAQTSAHYWYRSRSYLRLIIHFVGMRKWFSEVKHHFLIPPKCTKQDLYWYQKWTEKFELWPMSWYNQEHRLWMIPYAVFMVENVFKKWFGNIGSLAVLSNVQPGQIDKWAISLWKHGGCKHNFFWLSKE